MLLKIILCFNNLIFIYGITIFVVTLKQLNIKIKDSQESYIIH